MTYESPIKWKLNKVVNALAGAYLWKRPEVLFKIWKLPPGLKNEAAAEASETCNLFNSQQGARPVVGRLSL